MKTVIMAGGKGTRIHTMFPDLPKPMIPIAGKPILEWEIENLRAQGFCDIIITVSYMKDAIINYFGDGSEFGVNIEYFIEDRPLGNAGALFELELTEDFILLNADVAFCIDFNRFEEFHRKKGGYVTIFTHPNSHPYDSGLIIAGNDDVVTDWLTKEDKRPKWYKNRVNAGIHIISPKVLEESDISSRNIGINENGYIRKIDLDRHILKPLCGTGKMYCYDSPEYVKDMGTPERYETVSKDYENETVLKKSLKNKQKAIFLDRDGTLNKYVGFLRSIDDVELLPRVSDAIKKINESEYLAVVITNQPVVARGEVTFSELSQIHNKIETLLGREGAYLNKIYFCPHHPDKGYDGEVPELKIECDCRKPKPGMIINAAEEYNIDLSQSWMVGDSVNDIMSGKAAGCKTAFIGEEDYGQDMTVYSLSDFVNKII